MEIILIATFTTLAFAAGAAIRDLAWRENASQPMRICSKDQMYKVVRLDSSQSWDMLDIHSDERE